MYVKLAVLARFAFPVLYKIEEMSHHTFPSFLPKWIFLISNLKLIGLLHNILCHLWIFKNSSFKVISSHTSLFHF